MTESFRLSSTSRILRMKLRMRSEHKRIRCTSHPFLSFMLQNRPMNIRAEKNGFSVDQRCSHSKFSCNCTLIDQSRWSRSIRCRREILGTIAMMNNDCKFRVHKSEIPENCEINKRTSERPTQEIVPAPSCAPVLLRPTFCFLGH